MLTAIARQRLRYLISDYLMLNIGWLTFNIVRFYSLPPSFTSQTLWDWLTMPQPLLGQFAIPLMMIALYALSGYYNSRNVFYKSRLDELLNTLIISFIGMLIVFFVVLINDNIPERMQNYDLMIVLMCSLFVPVYAVRLIITLRSGRLVRTGAMAINAFVIGTSRSAIELANRVNRGTRTGLRVVGYVETNEYSDDRSDEFDMPVIQLDDLEEAAREQNVHALIVTPHHNGMNHTIDLLGRLYLTDLSLFITPSLYHLITMRPRLSTVAGEPLIDITNAGIPASTANLKRLSDIVFSSIALVLLLPVYAVLAIAVKRDSPGPVFYRQERIGYRKKPFKIIKFRTMRTDAESSGPALSNVDDPRITRVGRVMRKYRLDELPQFWNVLVGEMSLIGPRPERQYYIDQIVRKAPYYCLLHQVRPGITSWGMVKFGYASTVDEMIERLRYDLLYIENVSLGVDLKIFIYTINTVITGRGV